MSQSLCLSPTYNTFPPATVPVNSSGCSGVAITQLPCARVLIQSILPETALCSAGSKYPRHESRMSTRILRGARSRLRETGFQAKLTNSMWADILVQNQHCTKSIEEQNQEIPESGILSCLAQYLVLSCIIEISRKSLAIYIPTAPLHHLTNQSRRLNNFSSSQILPLSLANW